ncbi:MAG: transporter substrate-binding domain-containing protein, partial [Gammaproteobacteria bacterium]
MRALSKLAIFSIALFIQVPGVVLADESTPPVADQSAINSSATTSSIDQPSIDKAIDEVNNVAEQVSETVKQAAGEFQKTAERIKETAERIKKALPEPDQKDQEQAAETPKEPSAVEEKTVASADAPGAEAEKPTEAVPVQAKPEPKPKYQDPFPADIRRIKDRGKLIVAQFHGERPGFFMIDKDARPKFRNYPDYMDGDERIVGYDIEIARKIAHRLGVDLEIQRTQKSFNDITRAVARGDADVGISKITVTMARGQYVRFTDPYVTLRIGLLINRLKELDLGREGDLMTLMNHPDTRIAVQRGTSWVSIGRDLFPRAQLVQYPNMKAAMDAALSGETVAFLNDEWNISAALQKSPEITLRVRLAFVPDQLSGLAIAVSPETPNLLAFLNLMVKADGLITTPEAMLNRYFEEGSAQMVASTMAAAEDTQRRSDISTLAAGIAVGLVVILGLVWLR